MAALSDDQPHDQTESENNPMSPTIHPDAPTDEHGYPVHPDEDRGEHICGRGKSEDRPPSKNGRDRDDVAFCCLVAGWGTGQTGEPGRACKLHGGCGGGPTGEANGSYKDGQFANDEPDPDEQRFGGWRLASK